jgi:hypothetical protein
VKNGRALALLASAIVSFATVADAQTIPAGLGETSATLLGTRLRVFTYRPSCSPHLVLAVFHGLGREAGPYRDEARPLADQLCAVVFAPEFDDERFPTSTYQRGGVIRHGTFLPPGARTVDMVAPLIAWARAASAQPALPYALIGHSAGGQFLGRVAAYTAPDAMRIVIANPSTWVLPSLTENAPYGFGKVPNAEPALRAYLALPITVLLGGSDTGRHNLSSEPEAVAQGANRLLRGRNTFVSAQKVARERGWAFGWTESEVPGVGHSATQMFASPQAAAAFR